jgi:hypothetical protein
MRYYFLDETNQPQGPVEVEALRKLRDANVLHGDSLVAAEGAENWVALKTVIPCLAQPLPATAENAARGAAVGGTNPAVKAAEAMLAHRKAANPGAFASGSEAPSSCGSLFFWIAALSVANALSGVVGSQTYFFFGLGISLIIGAIGNQLGPIGIGIAVVVNLAISAMFAVFGYFGNRYHLWPFIVGCTLYALDGLIFLVAGDWLGVLFHVGIFAFLVKGALATRGIGEVEG